jgi:hypothetical protein
MFFQSFCKFLFFDINCSFFFNLTKLKNQIPSWVGFNCSYSLPCMLKKLIWTSKGQKTYILYTHKLTTIILILGCLFWDNKYPRTFFDIPRGNVSCCMIHYITLYLKVM